MFWLVFTLVVFLSVGCFLYADANEKKGLWLVSGAILILIILGLFVFLNVYALIAFVLIFTIVCKFIIEFYTSNVIRTTVIQK